MTGVDMKQNGNVRSSG